jgi:hypothetical protein
MKYFLVLVGFLMACDRDGLRESDAQLTANEWQVVAFTVEPAWISPNDSIAYTDLMLITEACARDDYYSFEKNGIFTHHRAELRCTPDEVESSSSRWTLSARNGIRWLSIQGTPYYEVELLAIDNQQMQWHVPAFAMGDGQLRTASLILQKR